MKVLKETLSIFILTIGLLNSQEANQVEFKVKPVQIVSCDELPSSLSFHDKPTGYDLGFKIFYLIKGESLVDFKEDSLLIDYIKTKSGLDISKHRDGDLAYEQGSFPDISKDGKHGIFSLEVENNQFGKVESLSIKGSIIVLTALNRNEEKLELSVSSKENVKVGPFSFSIGSGLVNSFMNFASNSKKKIGIEVNGPLQSLIGIEVLDGKNKLKSKSSTFTSSKKTFFYPKPKGDKLNITVNYWTDLKENKVSFGE